MEKLTMGEQIPYDKLSIVIMHFLNKNTQSVEVHSFKFKHTLQNNQIFQATSRLTNQDNEVSVDETFLKNCIEYCVVKQIGNIVGYSAGHLRDIMDNMREFYFRMCTEGNWKSEFKFEENIVFATKVVGKFYKNMFLNISFTAKLESEIYIIIMFTLVGTKLSTNCFQVLEKKHFKNQNHFKQFKTQNRKDEDDQKDKEKEKSLEKKLSMTKRYTKSNRDSLLMQYGSRGQSFFLNKGKEFEEMKEKEEIVSPIDEFKQTLKENLYINPLPKIKKFKTVESLIGQNDEQTNHSQIKANETAREARNTSLLSTQISSSLKSEIGKRHVSIAAQNRPFKIKQRSAFFANHSFIIQTNSNSESNLEEEKTMHKEKQENPKFSSQHWNDIVWNLKEVDKQNNGSRYSNNKTKDFQDDVDKKRRIYQKTEADDFTKKENPQIINNKSCNWMIINRDIDKRAEAFESSEQSETEKKHQTNKNNDSKGQFKFRLDSGIKNFNEIESNIFLIDQPKKSKVSSRAFKSQKECFDIFKKERHYEMQSSMFMLPSMRNKLIF